MTIAHELLTFSIAAGLLTTIHATEGLLWFALLTIATRPLSRWLRSPRVAKTLDRVTGTVLIGFGVELALDRHR